MTQHSKIFCWQTALFFGALVSISLWVVSTIKPSWKDSVTYHLAEVTAPVTGAAKYLIDEAPPFLEKTLEKARKAKIHPRPI
jgi:hypothetical protein